SEVVRAVLGGEVERYAVLVRRYHDRYARYAARMLGSLDAGEDAVQDALVRAFDRLADCREPDKFAGWLFLILRNRCYAERRRRQREGRPLDERDDGVAAADRPDGTFEQTERMRALERSLAELPAERRAEGAEALRLVGAVDRTPVVLSPALDDRVMAVVRRHAASRTRRAWHWVTAPRDVELRLRLRPVVWAGALAIAAGVALLLLRAPAVTPVPASLVRSGARDSVFVRFVLYAPGARHVALAGTFNQWDLNAAPVARAGSSGVWTTTLALPVGQHQYA